MLFLQEPRSKCRYPPPPLSKRHSSRWLALSPSSSVFLGNLLGLPAISVPVGLGETSALPIGLHLMGEAWEEAKLLRLACALEQDGEHARPMARPPHFFHELDALLEP